LHVVGGSFGSVNADEEAGNFFTGCFGGGLTLKFL
jgi:hypothetical protein